MRSRPRSLRARDHLKIRRKQSCNCFGKVRGHKHADAGVPFAAAGRCFAREIVESGSGVGVDHAERCRLAAQIVQDAAEHGMLEYISKIAGMKFVVVVHSSTVNSARRPMRTRQAYVSLRPCDRCFIRRAPPASQFYRHGRRGAQFRYNCGRKNPGRDTRAPRSTVCRRRKQPSRRATDPDWP